MESLVDASSNKDEALTAHILLIEPFYTGSHKQLVDLLDKEISGTHLVTLPGKKWHWRARTSALALRNKIPRSHEFRTLFASSVLNLAELCALRPDLVRLRKVLYFHENQLSYPVQKEQERDFQYGYNQILSCLVADVVVFNSAYNMTSFLNNIQSYMKRMPEPKPRDLDEDIRAKCQVLNFPIKYPDPILYPRQVSDSGTWKDQESMVNRETNPLDRPLHVVWPHRWEHDKNPESFFKVMIQLHEEGHDFRLSVLGENYNEVPKIFAESHAVLWGKVLNWGYLNGKDDYYTVLSTADVVVSTSNHEFFGVAMLEATHLGCHPLVPNRLVYPEIFHEEFLYNTDNQLYKKLKNFCKKPAILRRKHVEFDTRLYSWEDLRPSYVKLLTDTQGPS